MHADELLLAHGPQEPAGLLLRNRREKPTVAVPRVELAAGAEAARTALELRRAQARAALVEGAEPSQAQLDDIDQAVQDMNDALLSLSGELTEMLESGEEPERRQAMSFAADALDTMITAEDQFRDTLSQEQIEALDDQALDPFSYISPDIIDTLQSLDQ